MTTKNRMLNISVESFDEMPLVDSPDVAVVLDTAPVIEPIPSSEHEHAMLERVRLIADTLEKMGSTGLGGQVAMVGLSVLADNAVSLEAFTLAGLAKTIGAFVAKVLEYIARFLGFVYDYIRRMIEERKLGKEAAIRLVNEAVKYGRANRGYTREVTGPSLVYLRIGKTIPAGPAEITRGFQEFRRGVNDPFIEWLKAHGNKISELNGFLKEAMSCRDLLEVNDRTFDAIESLELPPPPKGWKQDKDNYVPSADTWGDVSLAVSARKGITKCLEVSAVDFSPIEPNTGTGFTPNSGYPGSAKNASSSSDQVTLAGTQIEEFAKMSVGLIDATVDITGVYDKVMEIGKDSLNRYSRKYTGIDNGDLPANEQQEIARRNEIINNAVGYVSYVMTATSNYMLYINTIRSVISELVRNAITTAGENK